MGTFKTQAVVSFSSVGWTASRVRLEWKLFWSPVTKAKHRKSYYSATPFAESQPYYVIFCVATLCQSKHEYHSLPEFLTFVTDVSQT